MQTRTHNPFTTIHTEGALLPADLLQRVLAVDPKLDGLSAADYHLPAGEKPNEAINRSWNRLQGSWAAFRAMRERLGIGDFATGETRDRWLLPLFQELGYGRLQTAKAVELDGKSYPISHRWSETPIHLVGCGIKLDQRTAGAAGASRSSPHSLLQELLNRSPELLWGMVSNGLRLRVLRDNASLTRQAFLEFDLESMFEGEIYSDFAVLWLVCHQSRVEVGADGVRPCWLEAWSKVAQEQGLRALESLRQGVEGAIAALGSGFLRAPANQTLRLDLRSGTLGTQQYYRQLLRLVYRLIFLFVAEDRDLLFDPHSSPEARGRYLQHYSLARMRHMAERSRGGRHPDLYTALRLVTDILGGRKDSVSSKTGLGLPVLGGFLFSRLALPDLESAELENESLLSAIRHLTFMEQGRTHRVVDYKNLGARELGSVYESLLELHPLVNTDAATFELTAVSGSERKTTGSFFTPEELISLLLDSALNPVIAQTLAGAGSSIEKQIAALLKLRICDPACGSGHFLLAAARKLARLLAQLRTGEGEPAPEAMRAALREVISNCIYGVDINPMSVELCKVSLWMEALEPGKPLSFLDAHIQCGDSLVGVSPNLDISEIPDEAFNPAFGDDKATASALKKRNKRERGGSHSDRAGQLGFRFEGTHMTSMEDLARWLAERAAQVDAMPEDDSTQVQAKAKAFDDYHATGEYLKNRFELDLWTASFFWKIPKADAESMLAPTQQELIQLRNGGELDSRLVERVQELAGHLNFFHWELAFPKIFSGDNPGFDCVLGNPPWEMLQLDPREFFASKYPEVNQTNNMAERDKLIERIKNNDKVLYAEFELQKHFIDSGQKFIHFSKRFPLTSSHRINLMSLFAELVRTVLSNRGRLGIIVPTAIATDSFNQDFIRDIMQMENLECLYDFENRNGIFPGVHRAYKFCLLVLSKVKTKEAKFVFYALDVNDIKDRLRLFSVKANELLTLNPNTSTIPVFRTKFDAELTLKIYSRVPVLHQDEKENEWKFKSQLMFMMNTDSHLFEKESKDGFIRLFEGKMVQLFDHRAASVVTNSKNLKRPGQPVDTSLSDHKKPNYLVAPQYYIPEKEVYSRVPEYWNRKWLIVWKKVTSTTNERTLISTIVPLSGISDSLYVAVPMQTDAKLLAVLYANFSSLVLDYIVRQKLGGINLSLYHVEQLPILPPSAYTPADIEFIAPRVLELVYTAYDLRPFAEDMDYHGEPFRWDEVRRAQLRAELDAYYARLYGLTRDELRYILDPKEVHGEDFPGETFRVLKDKEIRLYGEFRTRRLVLEAWDALEGNQVMGYTGKQVAELPVTSYQSSAVSAPVVVEKKEESSAPVKKEPKPVEENPAQPMLSDFGLYKCQACGKMVMGYEKENHVKDGHGGKSVEWKRVK